MKNIIRHGEIVLIPATQDMSEATKQTNYIVGHSETGHHHVLEGECMVLERPGKDTLVQLDEDANLIHTKATDKHATVRVKEGIYRVLRKREYNPFTRVAQEVED